VRGRRGLPRRQQHPLRPHHLFAQSEGHVRSVEWSEERIVAQSEVGIRVRREEQTESEVPSEERQSDVEQVLHHLWLSEERRGKRSHRRMILILTS